MRYIDYGTMQSDAQRRVLEMQRRAHSAVHQQGLPIKAKIEDTDTPSDIRYTPDEAAQAVYTERTELSSQNCCDDNSELHYATEEICDTKDSSTKLPLRDPEQLLLLAILVLLVAEKADTILILALVYLLI